MKYFQANLVNFDDNNIPYGVCTVFFQSERTPTREEVEEYCREELDIDFEEVFSIEEISANEIEMETDRVYAL